MESVKGYTYRLTTKNKTNFHKCGGEKIMKKSLIAGAGVAALGLAVLPATGAFAAVINTMTDNIKVTVPASCSITNGNTDTTAAVAPVVNNYAKTVNNGEYATIGANDHEQGQSPDNTVEVTCNAQSGTDARWKLTAIGAGDGADKTKLYSGTDTIDSGTHAQSGATSNWDFKVTQTGNDATAADNFAFATWTPVPGTEKDLATGEGSTATGAFTMEYSVYVSGTQPGGTYQGAVKYTLYNPIN